MTTKTTQCNDDENDNMVGFINVAASVACGKVLEKCENHGCNRVHLNVCILKHVKVTVDCCTEH